MVCCLARPSVSGVHLLLFTSCPPPTSPPTAPRARPSSRPSLTLHTYTHTTTTAATDSACPRAHGPPARPPAHRHPGGLERHLQRHEPREGGAAAEARLPRTDRVHRDHLQRPGQPGRRCALAPCRRLPGAAAGAGPACPPAGRAALSPGEAGSLARESWPRIEVRPCRAVPRRAAPTPPHCACAWRRRTQLPSFPCPAGPRAQACGRLRWRCWATWPRRCRAWACCSSRSRL